MTPSFEIFPFGIASNFSALTDARTKSKKIENGKF